MRACPVLIPRHDFVQLDVTSAAPGTKYVIVKPTDQTAGTPTNVRVEFRDNSGVVDTTGQADVTLVVTGSAVITPSSGLVDIVNGVGIVSIRDFVAETVTLSLRDTQSTGKSVVSTQTVIFSPGALLSC